MSEQKASIINTTQVDDDDLDDLDDVLDQFSATDASPTANRKFNRPRTNTRVDALPRSIPGSGPGGAVLDAADEVDEDGLSADFAKELAKGMENLMREFANSDEEEGDTEESRARVLKAAWEAMLIEGMNGGSPGELPAFGTSMDQGVSSIGDKGKDKDKAGEGTSDFQDKIKQAMNKLRESESNLKSDSSNKAGAGDATNPESLEALLASLGDLGVGEGDEEDGELAGFLENMMGQLMSKEVLHDPLKELADSFPGYLEKPPNPLKPEDRTRYENQLTCVKKIIDVFDQPDYSDTDPVKNKLIVDLMSEMQSYGSPPPELMGPLPPGLEGMPDLGQGGCPVS